MRCINALSSALFDRNDPKTPLTNGEQKPNKDVNMSRTSPTPLWPGEVNRNEAGCGSEVYPPSLWRVL